MTMAIGLIVTFFCFELNIEYNLDLTFLSIAIIFPLVFTIRSSFRRREKALEHLSEFRSVLKTLQYFFMSSDKLTIEEKAEIEKILFEVNTKSLKHLENEFYDVHELDQTLHKVIEFTISRPETIPRNLRDKIFRFMKDLHESIENAYAIHAHRTPISLKAYCELFIYAFPLIYVPTIIFSIHISHSQFIIYGLVLLTQFILISLYNIQNQLEYPFDDVGLDDIKLGSFKIDR